MEPISPRLTSRRVGMEEGMEAMTRWRVAFPLLGPRASKKAAFGL